MTSKIPVKCPNCNARLAVRSEQVGKRLRCPKCERVLQVPDIEEKFEPTASQITPSAVFDVPAFPALNIGSGSDLGPLPQIQPAPAQVRPRSPSKNRILYLLGGSIVALFAIMACVLTLRRTEMPAPPPGPVAEILKDEGRLDSQTILTVINGIFSIAGHGTEAELAGEDEHAVNFRIVGSQCEFLVVFANGGISTVSAWIPTEKFFSEDEDANATEIQRLIDTSLAIYGLLCMNQQQNARSVIAVNEWMNANPFLLVTGSSMRMFGDVVVLLGVNEGRTSFIAKINADADTVAAAKKMAASEREEKTKDLGKVKSWTQLQKSLLGVDGFGIMPQITSEVIGSVEIGDTMLQVAEKLSIRGNEKLVIDRTIQVEWKDDTGTVLVTFERGLVTGKMGF